MRMAIYGKIPAPSNESFTFIIESNRAVEGQSDVFVQLQPYHKTQNAYATGVSAHN